MSRNQTGGLSRRGLFRVGAGAAAAAAASAAASTAYAQEEFDYEGWFDDVSNFDGTVDATGEDEVTVEVGAGDDGLVFEPAAVHVDPGTTVVFEWTGEGGSHNVVEEESGERYASELSDEAGTVYEVTYESDGISKYVCEPHAGVGMKGAIAVGDGDGVPDIEAGEIVVPDPDDGNGNGEGEDEEVPPAFEVNNNVLALYGVSAVIALLSPLGFVFLMRRQQDADEN